MSFLLVLLLIVKLGLPVIVLLIFSILLDGLSKAKLASSMLVPIFMLFALGLGVPMYSLALGFFAGESTPGWGWFAIMLISIAAIAGGVVIYIVARLQRKSEE